jgi:hypothetical protein
VNRSGKIQGAHLHKSKYYDKRKITFKPSNVNTNVQKPSKRTEIFVFHHIK